MISLVIPIAVIIESIEKTILIIAISKMAFDNFEEDKKDDIESLRDFNI